MIRRIAVASLTLAALFLSTSAAVAQSAPEEFRGTIVDTPQVSRGTTSFFRLHVDRWGTEEEALAYLQILKDKGQEGLLQAFRDVKEEAGFVQVGSQLGYPIIFARVIPTAEGRIVRAFTDRPIQFFEVRNSLRSRDYPFGIIEIRFDAKNKGKGEGEMVAAASAKFNDQGQLELEQYAAQPFKLLNMKAEPVKEKK